MTKNAKTSLTDWKPYITRNAGVSFLDDLRQKLYQVMTYMTLKDNAELLAFVRSGALGERALTFGHRVGRGTGVFYHHAPDRQNYTYGLPHRTLAQWFIKDDRATIGALFLIRQSNPGIDRDSYYTYGADVTFASIIYGVEPEAIVAADKSGRDRASLVVAHRR